MAWERLSWTELSPGAGHWWQSGTDGKCCSESRTACWVAVECPCTCWWAASRRFSHLSFVVLVWAVVSPTHSGILGAAARRNACSCSIPSSDGCATLGNHVWGKRPSFNAQQVLHKGGKDVSIGPLSNGSAGMPSHRETDGLCCVISRYWSHCASSLFSPACWVGSALTKAARVRVDEQPGSLGCLLAAEPLQPWWAVQAGHDGCAPPQVTGLVRGEAPLAAPVELCSG